MIGKLVKLGVVAGAVYAAKKISDKYKENNPEGVQGSDEKAKAYAQAAGEVYAQASEFVKDKAPGVIETVTEKYQQASDFVAEKAPGLVETLNEKYHQASDFIADKAPEITGKANEIFENVADKIAGLAEEFTAAATESTPEEDFDKVVDFVDAVIEEEPKDEDKE